MEGVGITCTRSADGLLQGSDGRGRIAEAMGAALVGKGGEAPVAVKDVLALGGAERVGGADGGEDDSAGLHHLNADGELCASRRGGGGQVIELDPVLGPISAVAKRDVDAVEKD